MVVPIGFCQCGEQIELTLHSAGKKILDGVIGG